MYILKIDDRENELIKKIKTINFSQLFKLDIIHMDVGDIYITKDDKNLIKFERKEYYDFNSSIIDGRYREQKCRGLAELQRNEIKKFIYILEGSSISMTDEMRKKIWGARISCNIRDNIQFINTNNVNDTIYFIIRLIERLIKEPDMISDDIVNPNCKTIKLDGYLGSVKSKKKANYTPEVCQILSIGSIPNISNSTASKIIKHYGCLMNLFRAYNNIDNSEFSDAEKIMKKERLLAPIQINEKRKIGNKTSKKIYDYLFIDNNNNNN